MAPKKPELVKNQSEQENQTNEAANGADDAGEDNGGLGHNGGTDALQQIFTDYAHLEENKKQLSKAQRDLRAKAKQEFNIASSVFAHEVRLQKMDSDVRIQFEEGHAGLKEQLGIQFTLGILGDDEDGEQENDPEAAASKLAGKKKR